jgi:hypothetical protein
VVGRRTRNRSSVGRWKTNRQSASMNYRFSSNKSIEDLDLSLRDEFKRDDCMHAPIKIIPLLYKEIFFKVIVTDKWHQPSVVKQLPEIERRIIFLTAVRHDKRTHVLAIVILCRLSR